MSADATHTPHQNYTIKNREILAEDKDMRFTEFTLDVGEHIPWHIHSAMTDWHICLEGRVRVDTSPGPFYDLGPGERIAVPNRTAHSVINIGDTECKFVIVQGGGPYDFLPLES